MSAMPTGSLTPDSPSRIVPVRPPTSRLPRTENMTAGSVGASAAPRRPAVVQLKPKSARAASVIRPAVANVPTTPSSVIGTIAARKRGQPTRMPPSNRIATSARTAMRSTSRTERAVPRLEKTRAASAAASRKIAGAGTANRSLTLFERTASEKTSEATAITRPKCVTSLIESLVSSGRA